MKRILAVVIGALTLSACSPGQTLRMGTGIISHTICTAEFVSGVDGERAYRDALTPVSIIGMMDWALRYRVDREKQEVTATVFGGFEQKATYREGSACQSYVADGPAVKPPAIAHSAPLLPEIAGAAVVEPKDGRLRAALDKAFAVTPSGDGPRTKAVVVLRDGKIVAERYGAGYTQDTRVPGYSDSKAVTSALIGILVRQGKLKVNDPAPVAEWSQPEDPRHGITVDYLVRMRSGLDWDESLAGGPDDAARAWFLSPDQAGFAAKHGLADPPGSKWQYNSGNTHILSRIIRDAAGGTQSDVLRFAHAELFDPLGMANVAWELDAAGTPNGAAGMLATPRDWARFGQLYLQDGVVGSKRILPEGWVDYSGAPAPDAFVGYGAGFWTNRGDSKGARYRTGWGMPKDSFYASGWLGQIILIAPKERMVIARFGWSHGPFGGMEEMSAWMGDVAAAVREMK